jgi:hypothetical protein
MRLPLNTCYLKVNCEIEQLADSLVFWLKEKLCALGISRIYQ